MITIKLWTSNFKKILMFTIVLSVIAIVFGIMYYLKQTPEMKEIIKSELGNISSNEMLFSKNYFISILLFLVLIILSLIGIGIPALIALIFYELFSFSFMLMTYINTYGFKGLLFILVFFILVKIVTIFIYIYLLYIGINASKKIIYNAINKRTIIDYIDYRKILIRGGIILLIFIVNTIVINNISMNIVNSLLFLLK